MTELETSYGRLEERQTESRHRLIAIPAVRHKASCIRSQSVDREPEEKSSPEHQVSYSIKHINWGQKKKSRPLWSLDEPQRSNTTNDDESSYWSMRHDLLGGMPRPDGPLISKEARGEKSFLPSKIKLAYPGIAFLSLQVLHFKRTRAIGISWPQIGALRGRPVIC